MKPLLRLAAMLIAVAQVGFAAAAPLDRSKVVAAATEVMAAAKFATLITEAADGHADARIVTPTAPDANAVVWISTRNDSRKVAQLRKDRRATLVYFDSTAMSYVTLVGEADLVSDADEKQRHWQAEWQPFFRDGAKDAHLILIEFKPRKVEIVSPRHHLIEDAWGLVAYDLKEK